MSAYVISDISGIQPERIGEYLSIAVPSIEAYGGRYLSSTTNIEMLEGDPAPERYVLVEFESMERARTWYSSPEYEPARALQPEVLARRLLLVDGTVD